MSYHILAWFYFTTAHAFQHLLLLPLLQLLLQHLLLLLFFIFLSFLQPACVVHRSWKRSIVARPFNLMMMMMMTVMMTDDGYDDGYGDIDDDEMNLAECDGANDVKSHCGQQLPL